MSLIIKIIPTYLLEWPFWLGSEINGSLGWLGALYEQFLQLLHFILIWL